MSPARLNDKRLSEGGTQAFIVCNIIMDHQEVKGNTLLLLHFYTF
jgi:hypothetical protein